MKSPAFDEVSSQDADPVIHTLDGGGDPDEPEESKTDKSIPADDGEEDLG